MQYLLYFLLADFIFMLGYMLGSWITNSTFTRKRWELLEWDSKVMGFRVMSPFKTPKMGGRYMMAVEITPEDYDNACIVAGGGDLDRDL